MSIGSFETVDLRSDTVTAPGAGMRAAMAAAEVGDDLFGEDPTVRALEDRLAGLFGFSGALFTPSGVMANQIALQLLVGPGEELVCDAEAHILAHEEASPARYGGIQTRTVTAERGVVTAALLAGVVRRGTRTRSAPGRWRSSRPTPGPAVRSTRWTRCAPYAN